MASIKDVAARAGVSVATVSRVLNGNPRVKQRLREQVERAIAELDYQPSGIARNMRNQSVPVIGLIISDIQNPFFTAMVRAVEDVAHANHHTVLLCNSDEDVEKERVYIRVLSTQRVAGVIIVPTGNDCYEPLRKYRVPIVVADRHVPGLAADSVVVDNVGGAYEATKHLIALGHKRIGLVGAPVRVSVGMERRMGYERALRVHGLPVDGDLIATGDFKEAGGYKAARQLLTMKDPPTAIFAVNNLMTMGTLQVIHELNLAIPRDVSVIGFDDMPWLPLLRPGLTAVRQPIYQIGAEAARLLFDRLKGDTCTPWAKLTLQTELVVRQSTARPTA